MEATMINLRTARWESLDLSQRAEACRLAYQDGREEMESDLAGDGVTIGEYESLDSMKIRGNWLNVVEREWQTDQCPDEDWTYWSHESAGSADDPRYEQFVRGWTDREIDLRADESAPSDAARTLIVALCKEAGDSVDEVEMIDGFLANHDFAKIEQAARGNVSALMDLRHDCGLPIVA